MSANRQAKRVFIVATVSVPSGRKLVSGIFRHLETDDSDWIIELAQDGDAVTAESVRAAAAKGLDGFLVSLPCPDEAYAAMAETGLPCVVIHGRGVAVHLGNMRFVGNDSESIGLKAAEHLLQAGDFASFAFYGGDMDQYWIAPRLRGFTEALRAKRRSVEVFPGGDNRALRNWLRALPRPAAVFAAYDTFAADVVAAARTAGLAVPLHIAVLGVDDSLEKADGIGLSSIVTGVFTMGLLAARTLDLMMEGRHVAEGPVKVPPAGIAIRASTTIPRTPVQLVARARDLIRERACDGLDTNALAAALGVSRSTLEHRFHEVTGETVREAIEAVRLAKVKKRLASARGGTLAEIAAECGFSSPEYLSHVFRRRFGKPPGAARSASRRGR